MKSKIIYLYNLTLFICVLKEFFVISVSWNLSSSFIQVTLVLLNYIFIILAAFLYFVELITFKEDYLYYLLFVPICIFIFYISQHTAASGDDVLFSVILILLAKKLDFTNIIKFLFGILTLGTLIIVLGSFIHITNNIAIDFPYGRGYSCGFGHPNTFGVVLVNILLLWTYLHSHIKLKYVFGLSILFFLIIWIVAKARTSSIMVVFIPLIVLINKNLNNQTKKRLSFFLIPSVLLFFILSYYLMIKLGGTIWNTSSGFDMRFNYAYYVLSNYGIHCFGAKIPFISTVNATNIGQSALVLDSAYLRTLLSNGILPTTLMGIFLLVLFYRSCKKNKLLISLIAVIYLFGAMMEHYFAFSWYNFTLLGTFANLLNIPDHNFKREDEIYERKKSNNYNTYI